MLRRTNRNPNKFSPISSTAIIEDVFTYLKNELPASKLFCKKKHVFNQFKQDLEMRSLVRDVKTR